MLIINAFDDDTEAQTTNYSLQVEIHADES